jgi:hypothetical protein
MNKSIITLICIIFMLFTVATANATTYTSTFDVSGSVAVSGTDPLKVTFSGIAGTINANLPPSGLYDWSVYINNFAIAGYSGSIGQIDIGTLSFLLSLSSGSATASEITVPFSLFGSSSIDDVLLKDFKVDWTKSGNSIVLDITASSGLSELKSHLAPFSNSTNFTIKGSLTATPVPEPSSIILLGIGLIGFAGVSRRKFMK